MRFLKTVQVRVSQYTHTPILAKKKIKNSREHFSLYTKFIIINKYISKNIWIKWLPINKRHFCY